MTKTSPAVKTLNILLIAVTVAVGAVYSAFPYLSIKSVASGAFLLLGAVNLYDAAQRNSRVIAFARVMVVAIFFAFLGDIVLELDFMIGALVFGVGHIFYAIAYGKLMKWQKSDLLPVALLAAFSCGLILFFPIFDFGDPPVMKYVCVVYALVISTMLGKAFANWRRGATLVTTLILLGSFLFFFSDMMLLFRHYAHMPRITSILCVNTYYPAQAILSHLLLRSTDA